MQALRRILAIAAAAALLMVAMAPGAAAQNGDWVPPTPNGNTPDPDDTTPPVGDPGDVRPDCIRIDFEPNYGPAYVLEFDYDIVIMSDGTANLVYTNPTPGDTLSGAGGPLSYVIKCGFGGLGTYAAGDVTVIANPIVVPPPPAGGDELRKIEFTLDGCQPGSIATASVAGAPSQDFTVPASGVVAGYIVLPAGVSDPTTITATCNGFTVTVPVTARSAELIIAAAGLPAPDAAVAPIPPAGDSTGGNSTGSGSTGADAAAAAGGVMGGVLTSGATAPVEPTADSLPTVPVAVAPSYDAIVAATMTDQAASITLPGLQPRTFTLDGVELANPASTEAIVTGSGAEGDEYRVAPAPLADVASAAATVAEGSDAALPVLRMALAALAVVGLAVFAWRRQSGRNVSVTPA